MNAKHLLLAAVMTVMAAALSVAQTPQPASQRYSDAYIDRVEKNFACALGMENKGVVEDALAIVTKFKLARPEERLPRIMKEVRYLATHSKYPIIRYKACLAEAVFENPAQFMDVAARTYGDPKAFFNALEERMNSQLMSSN